MKIFLKHDKSLFLLSFFQISLTTYTKYLFKIKFYQNFPISNIGNFIFFQIFLNTFLALLPFLNEKISEKDKIIQNFINIYNIICLSIETVIFFFLKKRIKRDENEINILVEEINIGLNEKIFLDMFFLFKIFFDFIIFVSFRKPKPYEHNIKIDFFTHSYIEILFFFVFLNLQMFFISKKSFLLKCKILLKIVFLQLIILFLGISIILFIILFLKDEKIYKNKTEEFILSELFLILYLILIYLCSLLEKGSSDIFKFSNKKSQNLNTIIDFLQINLEENSNEGIFCFQAINDMDNKKNILNNEITNQKKINNLDLSRQQINIKNVDLEIKYKNRKNSNKIKIEYTGKNDKKKKNEKNNINNFELIYESKFFLKKLKNDIITDNLNFINNNYIFQSDKYPSEIKIEDNKYSLINKSQKVDKSFFKDFTESKSQINKNFDSKTKLKNRTFIKNFEKKNLVKKNLTNQVYSNNGKINTNSNSSVKKENFSTIKNIRENITSSSIDKYKFPNKVSTIFKNFNSKSDLSKEKNSLINTYEDPEKFQSSKSNKDTLVIDNINNYLLNLKYGNNCSAYKNEIISKNNNNDVNHFLRINDSSMNNYKYNLKLESIQPEFTNRINEYNKSSTLPVSFNKINNQNNSFYKNKRRKFMKKSISNPTVTSYKNRDYLQSIKELSENESFLKITNNFYINSLNKTNNRHIPLLINKKTNGKISNEQKKSIFVKNYSPSFFNEEIDEKIRKSSINEETKNFLVYNNDEINASSLISFKQQVKNNKNYRDNDYHVNQNNLISSSYINKTNRLNYEIINSNQNSNFELDSSSSSIKTNRIQFSSLINTNDLIAYEKSKKNHNDSNNNSIYGNIDENISTTKKITRNMTKIDIVNKKKFEKNTNSRYEKKKTNDKNQKPIKNSTQEYNIEIIKSRDDFSKNSYFKKNESLLNNEDGILSFEEKKLPTFQEV